MNGPLRAWANEHHRSFSDLPVTAAQIAGLIQLADEGKVSFNIASTKLFEAMLQAPDQTAEALATSLNLCLLYTSRCV